jgi:D-arabinose 1-dehydrogenase-like Zn-dependent alcohol dehydrogenase
MLKRVGLPVDIALGTPLTFDIVRGILGYSRAIIEKTVALAEEHDLHPHLGAVYEWEDAPKAFDHLRRGDFVGKIIIKV